MLRTGYFYLPQKINVARFSGQFSNNFTIHDAFRLTGKCRLISTLIKICTRIIIPCICVIYRCPIAAYYPFRWTIVHCEHFLFTIGQLHKRTLYADSKHSNMRFHYLGNCFSSWKRLNYRIIIEKWRRIDICCNKIKI